MTVEEAHKKADPDDVRRAMHTVSRLLVDAQIELSNAYEMIAEESQRKQDRYEGLALGTKIRPVAKAFAGPPMRLLLVLPDFPPKIRVYDDTYRQKHYHAIRKRWEKHVAAALEGGKIVLGQPWDQATVLSTMFVPRPWAGDPDNFSVNFIHNALVRNGIVRDDSWRNLCAVRRATVVPREEARTEVLIVKGQAEIDGLWGNLAR